MQSGQPRAPPWVPAGCCNNPHFLEGAWTDRCFGAKIPWGPREMAFAHPARCSLSHRSCHSILEAAQGEVRCSRVCARACHGARGPAGTPVCNNSQSSPLVAPGPFCLPGADPSLSHTQRWIMVSCGPGPEPLDPPHPFSLWSGPHSTLSACGPTHGPTPFCPFLGPAPIPPSVPPILPPLTVAPRP